MECAKGIRQGCSCARAWLGRGQQGMNVRPGIRQEWVEGVRVAGQGRGEAGEHAQAQHSEAQGVHGERYGAWGAAGGSLSSAGSSAHVIQRHAPQPLCKGAGRGGEEG